MQSLLPHTPRRFDRLDALRGGAIVWMAAFHFAFDLNYFGLVARQNFHVDPLWTVQRACIVSLFMFCAGLSQAVAAKQSLGWPRFWRRWAQVAGCALLVTAGSWFMFPRSYITFGVLHGLAVMLIVARLSGGWSIWLWPLGALAIALPHLAANPFFDAPALSWIGLVTHKPVTEDYVPLLPWMGVMWWGMAAGQWLIARRPTVLQGALHAAMRPLAALGRWSLSFYMLHQPILIGLLMLWLQWRR
ncbi:MAG: heparan-alpha-glucosaminide N-acetyltransferase [Burkholderiales bacterium]